MLCRGPARTGTYRDLSGKVGSLRSHWLMLSSSSPAGLVAASVPSAVPFDAISDAGLSKVNKRVTSVKGRRCSSITVCQALSEAMEADGGEAKLEYRETLGCFAWPGGWHSYVCTSYGPALCDGTTSIH